ncbi:Uncharacterized BCR, YitT family COG1284 [Megamonas hypermegale]|uniref:Uncharacterized BCR, YitT family COG1284 n=1 Tax=Megamonas hypermegale TaxID=158847 RepID=A0A378NNI1_9FIRM|nr:DUF6198 family protein [Megamonas hypermegale]STY69974.1 Uncharacterized BCR, YitT family COG1284 [Megamonas hypermegale]
MIKRYGIFLIGLTFMSLGIVLIIKSALGTSPISSVPYVLSLALPFTVGQFNFVFSSLMFILQPIILRNKFEWVQILQVPMTFIFCAFIDLFMYIFAWLHPQAYYQHIFVLLIGCICMGIGVTCQLLGRVVMLPGEGLVNAIATRWKLDFGKIKVIFDWSLVAMAAVISLYYFGTIEGIREGTLVSAFATGMLVKFFMNMLLKIRIKRIGKLRQQCRINKLKSNEN